MSWTLQDSKELERVQVEAFRTKNFKLLDESRIYQEWLRGQQKWQERVRPDITGFLERMGF